MTDQTSPVSATPEDVLNGIRDALETRGYAHMANGRDIGILVDELETLQSRGHAQTGQQWRSIETAPKDGTEIWLGNDATDPRRQRVCVCFWSRNGWRSSHDDEALAWQPSHWQPYFIPAPPAVADTSTLQPDPDRERIARAICCPSGCSYLGDSEDGEKCYCDTSDFHGSGIEKKTDAVLAALSVTSTPALTDALKEVARLRAGLESIVNCRNPLTRAAVREACAEILAAGPTDSSTGGNSK